MPLDTATILGLGLSPSSSLMFGGGPSARTTALLAAAGGGVPLAPPTNSQQPVFGGPDEATPLPATGQSLLNRAQQLLAAMQAPRAPDRTGLPSPGLRDTFSETFTVADPSVKGGFRPGTFGEFVTGPVSRLASVFGPVGFGLGLAQIAAAQRPGSLTANSVFGLGPDIASFVDSLLGTGKAVPGLSSAPTLDLSGGPLSAAAKAKIGLGLAGGGVTFGGKAKAAGPAVAAPAGVGGGKSSFGGGDKAEKGGFGGGGKGGKGKGGFGGGKGGKGKF